MSPKQRADLFGEDFRDCIQELSRTGIAALAPLYDLAAQRMVRLALAIVRNRHDAEDATQAAIVHIAAHAASVAAARSPWAYALRIVRNEALQIARRKKRLRIIQDLCETETETPRVSLEVDQKEDIRAALRALPPEQSEVVVLKIWENMTFSEIGHVLRQSPNTVASRYRYAMEKLQRRLHALQSEVSHD